MMRSHAGSDAGPGVGRVIEAIGTEHFAEQLLSLLHHESGAEHCSVFEFGSERLNRLASVSLDGTDTAFTQCKIYQERQLWRSDPMIVEARHTRLSAGPVTLRINTTDLPPGDLRDIVYGRTGIGERIMICGAREQATFGISVLRCDRHGGFSAVEAAWLQTLSATLISTLAKHTEIIGRAAKRPANLRSLSEIEATIAARSALFPRREGQVCARILYGLSTIGIALDIGIGEESVVTYRKRAFQRLGIATRRELLLWYLDL